MDLAVVSPGPPDRFCITGVEATYFSLLSFPWRRLSGPLT